MREKEDRREKEGKFGERRKVEGWSMLLLGWGSIKMQILIAIPLTYPVNIHETIFRNKLSLLKTETPNFNIWGSFPNLFCLVRPYICIHNVYIAECVVLCKHGVKRVQTLYKYCGGGGAATWDLYKHIGYIGAITGDRGQGYLLF